MKEFERHIHKGEVFIKSLASGLRKYCENIGTSIIHDRGILEHVPWKKGLLKQVRCTYEITETVQVYTGTSPFCSKWDLNI